MSFRKQLLLSWGIGIPFCFLAMVLWVMFNPNNVGGHNVEINTVLFGLVEICLGIGAPLIIFGGIMRPLHRWFWIEGNLRDDPKVFKVYLGYGQAIFWRLWLHVDALGNDLDLEEKQ
ncbi:MAG: hypothetical protein ACI9KK_000493 [Ascidiaceihabitans sp.]|jgi:hypothetical protein